MELLHLDPPVIINVKRIRRPKPYKQPARRLAENAVAPNLLQRESESYGPRTVLPTGITYVPYLEGKHAYLSTVPDAYTKEILADS